MAASIENDANLENNGDNIKLFHGRFSSLKKSLLDFVKLGTPVRKKKNTSFFFRFFFALRNWFVFLVLHIKLSLIVGKVRIAPKIKGQNITKQFPVLI